MKNICQSCGMPLSKDPQGGGSEASGKKSTLYCSHCYKNGTFTDPHITQEQMTTKVKNKLKEMGTPSILRWFFTKRIAKLKRWKKCDQCH